MRIIRIIRAFLKLDPKSQIKIIFLSLILGTTLGILLLGYFLIFDYESISRPSPPPYTQPAGFTVTTKCVTRGDDCHYLPCVENGSCVEGAFTGLFVYLWSDVNKSKTIGSIHPEKNCVATRKQKSGSSTFWFLDCGQHYYNGWSLTNGWVREENIVFDNN